jgi:tape measure domain-containing protein
MSVQIQVQSNSRQAQADLRNLERSLRAVEQSTVQINQSLSRTGNLVKFAFAALPLGAIATKAISTAASFEKLSARLDVVTGSAVKTSQALAGVQKLVKETPFNVQVLTDGYARLAATGNAVFKSQAGIERGLQAIANATAAVGGSNVEFRNVATAFERASSEGRITAERLNQLVDAGIPLTRVADRLGLSMEELRKETEKGNFTFDRFYQAFVDVAEAADGFGGAASRQVNTLNGAFSNLNDALDILFDRVVRQSGVSRILVRSIVDITKAINDFSEGIDLSILISINNFRFFVFQLKNFSRTIGKEFDKLASTAISFLPEFNFDVSDLQNQLSDAFGQINIKNTVTAYTMQLSDFLPGLETVKSAIQSFGNFIKHVFWDIYDQVVGNSFWPDMIDGVVFYASGLLGKVKPYFDKFRDYVNGIFLEMKNSFDELFKDIQIRINVSSETGSIKTIASFIDRITTTFDRLVKAAKEQPIIVKTVDAVTEAINSIRQAGESIDPAVWSAMSGAFNAINVFAKDGLPRLLAAIGLTKDVKEVKSSSGNLGETTRNLADQLQNGSKKLSDNINNSTDGLSNSFREGIVFSEQLQKVYNSIGETIGRIIGRVFFDEVYSRQNDFADFFALAVAAALSRPLRNLLAVTAVLTLVLGPDNNVSTILSKVFDSISQFGNKVLQGAGLTGYLADTSLGGFIAGLLFGGLSLALVTGRLGPILLAITKTIGEYVFFRKVLGNSDAAIPDADRAGKTLGQKFGSAFNTAARTAGFGIGLAIGASLADDVIKGFNIENELTKVMVTAGLVGGAAYAGSWIASALVVFTGAKLTALWTAITVAAAKFFGTKALAAVLLAALIPSSSAITAGIAGLIATIAGVLTLPVILTALGIASGAGLLYYIFFGAGDDTFAGKFRKAIEDNVFAPLKSSFEDLMSFVSKGIEKLTGGFVSFRKSVPMTRGESPVPEFATGGRIRGPGSGTSDSIMARVSNGEYVINANATRNNLPLLEAINNGQQIPAFKNGGKVGSDKVSLPLLNKNFTNNQLNLLNALGDYGLTTKLGLSGGLGAAQKESGENLNQLTEDVGDGNSLLRNKYRTMLNDYFENGVKGSKVWAKSFFRNVEKQYPNVNKRKDYLNNVLIKDFIGFQYMKAGAGNKTPQDGWDFRGRGWLQYTGREVYKAIGYLSDPDLLSSSIGANIDALPKYLRYKSLSASTVNSLKTPSSVAKTINNAVNPGKPSDAEKIVKFISTNIQKFATGGKVNGPGSGTSDSILAQLSNGEYVINAQATKQNLPLLEQINKGNLPKFNQGGSVGNITDRIRQATGTSVNTEKLTTFTTRQLFDLERALKDLEKRTKQLAEATKDGAEPAEELIRNYEDISLNLMDRLAPAIDTVVESVEELKANFSALGSEQASGFKEVFKSNLQTLFKGGEIEGGFLKALALDFTGRVVNSFTSSLVDSFFKTSDVEKGLGSLFSEIFGLGNTTGEAGGGAIKGLFTKPKADGSSPDKAAYVRNADGGISGPTSTIVENLGLSGISKVNAGSEQDKMLAEQMEGLPSNMDAIFEKFKFGFQDIANGDFLSGIGKIFQGGLDGFSSIFSSIGSLFGGGGGGGSGMGSLISLGMSLFGFANGGYVSGRGTGTSDSIPAMLSNGEYVINAKATKMTKPLLEAINQGKLPKFAVGGLVTDSGMTSASVSSMATKDVPSKGSSEQVFNINITGDISNQTKSEIYKMLPQIASGVNSYNREKNIRR